MPVECCPSFGIINKERRQIGLPVSNRFPIDLHSPRRLGPALLLKDADFSKVHSYWYLVHRRQIKHCCRHQSSNSSLYISICLSVFLFGSLRNIAKLELFFYRNTHDHIEIQPSKLNQILIFDYYRLPSRFRLAHRKLFPFGGKSHHWLYISYFQHHSGFSSTFRNMPV